MALTPGTLLKDRYRIVSVLGQGGMGSVYCATDELLDVFVAVKENLFLAEEFTRQFEREARILASVRHPCLPRVGDYCSIPGQGQYLIMDFIDGEDLRDRIERDKILSESEVIWLGAKICGALTYLHTRQPPVIHRDIKPGNIKVNQAGEVFLVDFGLAKLAENPLQATITGARAMTPGYSPPEQYGTARTDARSDIYSLGATLYVSLTGSIPEDALERMTGKSHLTPVKSLRENVRSELAAVIEKALEIDPVDRYQSANELRIALLGLAEEKELKELYEKTIVPVVVSSKPVKQAPEGEKQIPKSSSEIPVKGNEKIIEQPKQLRKSNAWLIILLVLAVAGIGIGLVSYLNPRPTQMVLAYVRSHLPTNFPVFIQAKPTTVTVPTKTTTPIIATTQPLVTGNAKVTDTYVLTSTPHPLVNPSSTGTPSASVTIIPTATQTQTPTQTLTPQNTPIGGGSSTIAFVSDRSGSMQIWLLDFDGKNSTNERKLTSIKDGACQPDYSPDGKQIIFISPCAKESDAYLNSQLYIMDADGKNIHPLTISGIPMGLFDPAWSPDGKRIAFTSNNGGAILQIFTYDMEKNLLQVLSRFPYDDRDPAWSPDGKQLVFAHKQGVSALWTMGDDGNDWKPYTKSGNFDNSSPAWSPDRSLIVFSQTNANKTIPWLVSLSYDNRGTPHEKRLFPGYPIINTRFSPDSKWLVFESWPDGKNHDIYVSSVNGDNLIRLTRDPGFDGEPVWQPVPKQ